MKIESAIALITGANRGIGKSYAQELLKAGAKKIYVCARDPKNLSALVDEAPGRIIPLRLDVTNPADIQAVTAAAPDVNLLINNAGIAFFDDLEKNSAIENARQQFEVNFIGPLALTQAFAPILKGHKGVMVTVSSIGGHVVFPQFMTYCASKFAAHAFILGARQSLQPAGVRVIGVYPGPIDTDMAKDVPMDKFPPSQVALSTIAAIEDGMTEEVFTDSFSQELYNALRADPKAVERQMIQAAAENKKAA